MPPGPTPGPATPRRAGGGRGAPWPTGTWSGLCVEVAPGDMRLLRRAGYLLCVGLVVDGGVTAVWLRWPGWLARTWIGLGPRYAIAAALDPGGRSVSADRPVAPGQTAVLGPTGRLLGAADGGAAGAIGLENRYGPVHPILKRELLDPAGRRRLATCYRGPAALVPGTVRIGPSQRVRIWFDQDGRRCPATGIARHARSRSIEVEADPAAPPRCRFADGRWALDRATQG